VRTDCGAGAWSISVLGWISQINGLEVLQGFYPSSALVFITNGPYAATGFWLGSVASSVE